LDSPEKEHLSRVANQLAEALPDLYAHCWAIFTFSNVTLSSRENPVSESIDD